MLNENPSANGDVGMALVLRCDAVFLHVPKTGGEWVEAVLRDLNLVKYRVGSKHADLRQLLYYSRYHSGRQFVRDLMASRVFGLSPTKREEGFYKFCFVRHPLSWCQSYFKFNAALGWRSWGPETKMDLWHPNMILDELCHTDFSAFVAEVAAKRPGYVTELYGWYTLPEIDFVGKQEYLVDDLIHVLRQLNVKFDEGKVRAFPPKNVSSSRISVDWEDSLRASMMSLESVGIKRYGYEPGQELLRRIRGKLIPVS